MCALSLIWHRRELSQFGERSKVSSIISPLTAAKANKAKSVRLQMV